MLCGCNVPSAVNTLCAQIEPLAGKVGRIMCHLVKDSIIALRKFRNKIFLHYSVIYELLSKIND